MKKQSHKFLNRLKESPINYFSDLFIVAMVVLWIADNLYESIIATYVTIASVMLSFKTGMSCFEVSMWSSIGTNIAVPLGAGGALWMIKNAVVHAISNQKGKECTPDFPNPEPPEIDLPEFDLSDIPAEDLTDMEEEPK